MPNETIITAAQTYLSRRERRTHPVGTFDKAGRWYPKGNEKTADCAVIRPPSRAYPYSLMLHCRTAAHVAALYGVAARDVRRTAKQILDASQET